MVDDLPVNAHTLLQNLDGDRSLAVEMIDVFLEDCPSEVERIEQAWSRQDASALARSAHSLKGMAAVIAATRLYATARGLETLARHQPMDAADAVMGTRQEAEATLFYLRSLRNELGATAQLSLA